MNVSSFALFGTRDLYWMSTPALIRAHNLMFKDWKLVIHMDGVSAETHPLARLWREYQDLGLVELEVIHEQVVLCRAMLWRMKPAWWNDGIVMCRDIDSLPTYRDRQMMRDFEVSGKAFHACNENPAHDIPLMGGMIAVHGGQFRQLVPELGSWEALLERGHELHRHGTDQELLSKAVWEKVRGSLCEHRLKGFACGSSPNSVSYSVIEDIDVPGINPGLRAVSEVMPYCGAAGFDVRRAVELLNLHGQGDVALAMILKAERRFLAEVGHAANLSRMDGGQLHAHDIGLAA